MNAICKTILCAVMAVATSYTSAADCFKMKAMRTQEKTIPIKRDVVGVKAFCPFPKDVETICGLSVSGTVEKENEDYFVRIILKDKKGMEHLVLESYEEINDAQSFVFSDYCEETALLANGAEPDSIKVVAKYAKVTLDKITYQPASVSELKRDVSRNADAYKELRKEQLSEIVNRINAYNIANRKLWRAGITSISKKSYATKKRVVGFSDEGCTNGIEYYVAGIFEVGSKQAPLRQTRNEEPLSPFVDHFDWRDRHGRNWMTSVKDQEGAGYCVPFAIVGAAEAKVNLYYNNKLDLDLSEQELGCCAADSNVYKSGFSHISDALPYVIEKGICDEGSYPFTNDSTAVCERESITPNEVVKYNSYKGYNLWEPDSVKKAIIFNGPIIGGFASWKIDEGSHAMTVAGYGTVHVGDTITYYFGIPSTRVFGEVYSDSIMSLISQYGSVIGVVNTHDHLVGKNYWIFKNSWGGEGESLLGGYMFVAFAHGSVALQPFSLEYPVTTLRHSSSDIVCSDSDGDGYYFWGLGPKPSHCPSWAPDTPDGNDSDINFGPMDEYGYLQALPEGITVNTSVSYTGNSTVTKRVGIVNGGTLTITGFPTMSGNARIRVCEGGTLIVDGGSITNADIELVPGSTLVIRNGGAIHMKSGCDFNAPIGSLVEVEDGIID